MQDRLDKAQCSRTKCQIGNRKVSEPDMNRKLPQNSLGYLCHVHETPAKARRFALTTHKGNSALLAGAHVVSADGKQLGIVKEVRADRFLVDVRLAADYWLGNEIVDDATEELVQLLIIKEAIGSAKLPDGSVLDGTGHADDFGGPAPTNRPPPSI
jgi:hypothetical protein